jgi:hypothetical protein
MVWIVCLRQGRVFKALNELMLTYSMYLEHIPAKVLVENIRGAINKDQEHGLGNLTHGQIQDLWEDTIVGVLRNSRQQVKSTVTPSGKTARKRGIND